MDLLEKPRINLPRGQRSNNLEKCTICGKISIYHYYGVRSCERCKQFFRRVILRKKIFKCSKLGCCDVLESDNCRSCRLDKCLFVGMEPMAVKIPAEFGGKPNEAYIAKLLERKLELYQKHNMELKNVVFGVENAKRKNRKKEMINCENEEITFGINDADLFESTKNFHKDPLFYIEKCISRIWHSNRALPQEYVHRQGDFFEFLCDYESNILAKANHFLEEPVHFYDKAYFQAKAETHGFFFPEHMEATIKDRFLCIEMAKAMPFFRRLDPQDQLYLMAYVITPLSMLFNIYYSAGLGQNEWTRSNGFSNLVMFKTRRYGNDKKIKMWTKKLFCDSVTKIKEADFSGEEFVFLLGIVLASSAASNISASGCSLIYDESVRYSKGMLNLLQQRYGTFGGARKFAEAMNIVVYMFQLCKLVRNLNTYLDLLSDYTTMGVGAEVRGFFPQIFRPFHRP